MMMSKTDCKESKSLGLRNIVTFDIGTVSCQIQFLTKLIYFDLDQFRSYKQFNNHKTIN